MNAQRMTVRYVYDGDTAAAAEPTKSGPVRHHDGQDQGPADRRGRAGDDRRRRSATRQQATDRLTRAGADRHRRSGWPRTGTAGTTTGDRLFHVWTDQGSCSTTSWSRAATAGPLRIWPNVTYASAMEAANATHRRPSGGSGASVDADVSAAVVARATTAADNSAPQVRRNRSASSARDAMSSFV